MDIIKRFKETYGNKYDYSLVEYSGMDTLVTIVCPIHGEFKKTPRNLLRSNGCSECQKEQPKTRELGIDTFINRAREIHGDKYDYSLVDYKTITTPVKIICPEHGESLQTPRNHIKGYGCVECAKIGYREKRMFDKTGFVNRAKEAHGDKYDYSLLDYKGNSEKVTIICPEHGEFEQIVFNHLKGYGCNMCGCQTTASKRTLSTEEFIQKAKEVHGEQYDYSISKYVGTYDHITITCKTHGEFTQMPTNHLKGYGCKQCVSMESKQEKEVFDFIKEHYNGTILENDRSIIAPKELDIVLPELKIAIEYCGLYWHSTRYRDKMYHKDKLEAANKAGYRLITIFEDEWVYQQDKMKSKLLHILGSSERQKIYARKTKVVEITKEQRAIVLNDHHIQGDGGGTINYGLEHDGSIIAVIAFKNMGEGVFDLNRFATSVDVVGGFSKLLSHFKKNNEWNEIYTFADRRWSVGNLYLTNGFDHVYNTAPNYFYLTKNQMRESRQKYMKHKLKDILVEYHENMSEQENMENNGYYSIYDCGNMKFVMKNV